MSNHRERIVENVSIPTTPGGIPGNGDHFPLLELQSELFCNLDPPLRTSLVLFVFVFSRQTRTQ